MHILFVVASALFATAICNSFNGRDSRFTRRQLLAAELGRRSAILSERAMPPKPLASRASSCSLCPRQNSIEKPHISRPMPLQAKTKHVSPSKKHIFKIDGGKPDRQTKFKALMSEPDDLARPPPSHQQAPLRNKPILHRPETAPASPNAGTAAVVSLESRRRPRLRVIILDTTGMNKPSPRRLGPKDDMPPGTSHASIEELPARYSQVDPAL